MILMDVTMPKLNGIEATCRIKAALPDVCVIGPSMYKHREMVSAMCEAGASAYVAKYQAEDTLIASIRAQVASRKNNSNKTAVLSPFVYRNIREIGSLTAALGSLDIGENSPLIRRQVCQGLTWLGVRIDPDTKMYVSLLRNAHDRYG